MRRLLGARVNAEDEEIPQDYKSQCAVLLVRLCDQHPGPGEVVGSQGSCPTQAGASAAPGQLLSAEGSGKVQAVSAPDAPCSRGVSTLWLRRMCWDLQTHPHKQPEGRLLLSCQ